MRFGPLEFGIVILMALIVFGVVRMMKIGKNAAEEDKAPAIGYLRKRTKENDEKIKRVRRSRIQIFGIIIILAGILVLLTSLNLVKVVFWGPIGAFIIVAVGLVTIFIARR